MSYILEKEMSEFEIEKKFEETSSDLFEIFYLLSHFDKKSFKKFLEFFLTEKFEEVIEKRYFDVKEIKKDLGIEGQLIQWVNDFKEFETPEEYEKNIYSVNFKILKYKEEKDFKEIADEVIKKIKNEIEEIYENRTDEEANKKREIIIESLQEENNEKEIIGSEENDKIVNNFFDEKNLENKTDEEDKEKINKIFLKIYSKNLKNSKKNEKKLKKNSKFKNFLNYFKKK